MNRLQYQFYREKILELLAKAHIVLNEEEIDRIEVADFGLGKFEDTGLGLVTYVNTQRVCAKEIIMLSRQTCPEHRHPPRKQDEGKEETFRCRFGQVYLYVEGSPEDTISAVIPKGDKHYYTVFSEKILLPGDQYTLPPNTLHWFQAGEQGAVVSEFSMVSTDESDIFTDPRIQRIPEITE